MTNLFPELNIAPKTAGAVAGGGIAIAVVTLISWVLSFWHITMPSEVGAALATIFSGLSSYWSPHSQPQRPQPAL